MHSFYDKDTGVRLENYLRESSFTHHYSTSLTPFRAVDDSNTSRSSLQQTSYTSTPPIPSPDSLATSPEEPALYDRHRHRHYHNHTIYNEQHSDEKEHRLDQNSSRERTQHVQAVTDLQAQLLAEAQRQAAFELEVGPVIIYCIYMHASTPNYVLCECGRVRLHLSLSVPIYLPYFSRPTPQVISRSEQRLSV